jgi:hypothetical protein
VLTVNRWDALLYGERKWVPSPPATKEKVMRTFHLRPADVVMAAGFTANQSFVEKFKERIRYMISVANSSWDNPETGKITHCHTMGYTQYLPDFDLARITFAIQMIGPLLRHDLSDSERLVIQYQIAKTVSRKNLFSGWKLKSQPDSSRICRKFTILIDLLFMPFLSLE